MSVTSLSQAVASLKQRLAELALPDAHAPVIQLKESVTSRPLMAWLASQQQFPKIYWHGRDSDEETAAIGSCHQFFFEQEISDEQLASVYQQQLGCLTEAGIRYYGGIAFDRREASWPDFGRVRFVLPRIELRRQQQGYELLLNLRLEQNSLTQEIDRACSALDQLCPAQPLTPPRKTEVLARIDTPSQGRWQQLVEAVTDPVFNADTPKVVLSRHSQLKVAETPNPWTVLATWQGRNRNSFQFGFQFSPERCFISCSPERLYQRNDHQLKTEALAGTTVRGLTPAEDEQLAQQLLDDAKNSVENQFVRTHIMRELAPLSDAVDGQAPLKIFKLNHIQHLHRVIAAKLKSNTSDFQLLQAMHPTPAVGGLPKANAMDFIREHEGYTRGWYAGACGYLSRHVSEFSVAIRSALIEPGTINLFAGAGILAGSDPASEWQELENKLATIMSILVDF
ncbi:isochorismate synthase [Shewanella sp. C32]|uniref:Isochorismate synthase MenF n=1 Tax=Shewanella electrica TaxID=515560 RepID=A0ABT2FM67_9GAMM|nr:isochorismate synthase [Shewanella electrica]MCH1925973.1 isochorismate synthase [Shewanella electrica]MCS4557420.1 isochorismate synthase [Shewanella electrica]